MLIIKTLIILVSAIFLFTLIVLVSFGGIFFFIACFGKSRFVSKIIAAEEKSTLSDYAEVIDSGRKKLKKLKKREVTVKSFDGLTLHGYLLSGKNHGRTIICVHGYHSDPIHDFGPATDKLLESADLLMIDQRAHGKSEGKYITFGVKECHDCKAWANWLASEKGCGHPVYFDGVSMGATSVLLSCSLELPGNVKGIIADCSFSSPKEIFSLISRNVFRFPFRSLIMSINVYCKLFAGFSLDEMNTADAMKKNKIPVLFAHGLNDSLVPYNMTQAAFDACIAPKFLVLAEGADHGMSYLVDRKSYCEALEMLFKKCEQAA